MDRLRLEGISYAGWQHDAYELCSRLMNECDYLRQPVSYHFDAETMDDYYEKFDHSVRRVDSKRNLHGPTDKLL